VCCCSFPVAEAMASIDTCEPSTLFARKKPCEYADKITQRQ
jgi:hypothetical protein